MTELALTSSAPALAASLEEAAADVDDLAAVNRRAGEIALEGADIPVRTGHLASTATVAADADGFALTATASYAGAVHARDPFFSEAIERRTDAITEAYADHLTDSLTLSGA